MRPQTQIRQDRLYLHWTDRCSYTTSYPIERGADGRRYVVFLDTDEMTEIREALGIEDAIEHVFDQTWDPRALALEDIDIDVEMD